LYQFLIAGTCDCFRRAPQHLFAPFWIYFGERDEFNIRQLRENVQMDELGDAATADKPYFETPRFVHCSSVSIAATRALTR
jgi:hypothetical protein